MRRKKWKIISSLFLILVLSSVIYLALQSPKETNELSDSVRNVFAKLGYKGNNKQFRSDFHLIEYFIVGLVPIAFCKAMGWKIWVGLTAACTIGILEETLKIFLPTREFGGMDVIKDIIGAGIAAILFVLKNDTTVENTEFSCRGGRPLLIKDRRDKH